MATPTAQVPPVVSAPVHTPVNPDTPITVKVSHNGGIRRFKLPLRDLGPAVLPGKLRTALAIPEGQQVRFERYSDSAASFVVLDVDNLTVYKQLYRAAKAKLKLRLKATIVVPENTNANVDELSGRLAGVEINDAQSPEPTIVASQPPAYTSQINLVPTETRVAPQPARSSADTNNPTITQAIADQVMSYFAGDGFTQQLQQSVKSEVEKQIKESSLKAAAPEPVRSECKLSAFIETEPARSFLVYCNSCQKTISGEHYHCSICEKGDYDLCSTCVDNGVHCEGDHWLIKRTLEKGRFISSTTEFNKRKQRSIAPTPPKPAVQEAAPAPAPAPAPAGFRTRTCNCCVSSLPEECFVTCVSCEDYDICLPCHLEKKHGHHPMHEFSPATKDTPLDAVGTALLGAGRGARHHAICDGCDTTVIGVRHKCLMCPDWDYCTSCFRNAEENHPGHKFVPIFEALNLAPQYNRKALHSGVRCDGPLCGNSTMYIMGDRYKCTVCEDLDLCSNCEASPINHHNRTHPLIKMKTPIQSISCSTTHSVPNGQPTLMGDLRAFDAASIKSTSNASTQVQTVADVEPSKEFTNEMKEDEEEKEELVEHSEPIPVPFKGAEPLQAEFHSDTIADGSSFPAGEHFVQVWTLTNTGATAWPAGVSVRFVGGDHMFHNGSEHSCNATVTSSPVGPGETASFSVNLTAPEAQFRRVISYWRLTDPSGSRFGHKLWCDIEIKKVPKLPEVPETVRYEDSEKDIEDSASSSSSQMIFPKLDKESQILAVEAAIPTDVETEVETETTLLGHPNPIASPAWTLTLDDDEGHTSDGITSEDDVESLSLDEDYEVLETSDDDGFRRVI